MPVIVGGTAATIKHKFVSGKSDGADGTLVQPSNWNANLNPGAGVLGQVLARDAGGADGGSWVDPAVAYQVRNLVGSNNAGTPNTQYDLSADLVVLRHTTALVGVTKTNTGVITNNNATVQAINGRDQAGAFAVSTWIHFYFIWDGTTLGTISSTVAPPTGPTLPAGFTYWAYAGAVYNTGGGIYTKIYMRGSKMFYQAPIAVVSSGSATTETAITITGVIPANALTYEVGGAPAGYAMSGNAVANVIDMEVNLRVVTGVNYAGTRGYMNPTNATGFQAFIIPAIVLPNISQTLFYIIQIFTGTTQLTNLAINWYSVPNGSG